MQLKKCACTNIFNVIALKHFGNFKAALHACNYVDQCLIFLHTMLHVMDLNANTRNHTYSHYNLQIN